MARLLLPCVALVGALALVATALAQDAPASKAGRLAYVVRHGNARELAGVLGKHFKGDAEVQTAPNVAANCLLIRATPAVLAEAVKLLEQLDRQPRLVAVKIVVAEVALPRKGEEAKAINVKELTGPADEVLSKLDALRRRGALGRMRTVRLTAVEGQLASTQSGEMKPIVDSMVITARGLPHRSISYRTVGMNVQVKGRVGAEGAVALDLDLQDARLNVAPDAPVLGKDESGAAIRAKEIVTSQLKTRLNVRPGQAVLAEGVQTKAPSGAAQTFVIVTARVVEPAAVSK